MMQGIKTREVPLSRVLCVVGVLMGFVVAAGAPSAASAQSARARVDGLVRDALAQHGVRAAIVQVKIAGRPVLKKAYGQSAAGVPASTQMHFRNGTVATAYMSTLLLRLADRGKVDLDDTLSKWVPGVRGASRVTLRMLAAMTAGYHDYATDPRTTDLRYANPFDQIATQEQAAARARAPAAVHAGHELELLAQRLRAARACAREDHQAAVVRRACGGWSCGRSACARPAPRPSRRYRSPR